MAETTEGTSDVTAATDDPRDPQTALQADLDGDSTREYEHLKRKQKEREGTVETATVEEVFVGTDKVVLTVGFEWTTATEEFRFDLDEDRDVLKLETLAEENGLEFVQINHLEGMTVDLVYTGSRWVPRAYQSILQGEGSAGETFRTELDLLARELARAPGMVRGGIETVRGLSTKQTIIAVILAKKVVVVALLVWLLVL